MENMNVQQSTSVCFCVGVQLRAARSICGVWTVPSLIPPQIRLQTRQPSYSPTLETLHPPSEWPAFSRLWCYLKCTSLWRPFIDDGLRGGGGIAGANVRPFSPTPTSEDGVNNIIGHSFPPGFYITNFIPIRTLALAGSVFRLR